MFELRKWKKRKKKKNVQTFTNLWKVVSQLTIKRTLYRSLFAVHNTIKGFRESLASDITAWAQEDFLKSLNIVHRSIQKCELKRRHKKKPNTSMIQIRCLLWTKAHLKWSAAEWETVLWSDESEFEPLLETMGVLIWCLRACITNVPANQCILLCRFYTAHF